MLTRIIAIALVATALPAPAKQPPPVRGRWVVGPAGCKPIHTGTPASDLQPSGLTWRDGALWSVSDGSSAFAGHIYRIDPATGKLDGCPRPLVGATEALRRRLRQAGRLDAEALVMLPGKRFLVAIEVNAVAILGGRLAGGRALVDRLWEPKLAPPAQPWQGDTNSRLEGLAFDRAGRRVYVAFERDDRGLPRIYRFPLPRGPAESVAARELPLRGLERLGGKPKTRLNANGLELIGRGRDARLLVLLRDRELIAIVDPSDGRILGQLPLALRSPAGRALEWASPEGIAYDAAGGRLFVVSDPAHNGRWRERRDDRPGARFDVFTPLLYVLPLPAARLKGRPR